ncbi:hypothetical protein D9M70_457470 [compost metagenome]
MTQIIQFFQFDENEYARRVADVELEYENTQEGLPEDNRYKEFISAYFPVDTRFDQLPGQLQFFSVEHVPPTAAINQAIANARAGYGDVDGFTAIQSPDFRHYVRWWQSKPAKQVKADKAKLAELVKQRYQTDLDEMNKAEEARQVELLVQQAERKRQQEEEQRIAAIREQARADLMAAYGTSGEVA